VAGGIEPTRGHDAKFFALAGVVLAWLLVVAATTALFPLPVAVDAAVAAVAAVGLGVASIPLFRRLH
jgi:uncharacterized membrane-anchored protein